MEYVKTSKSAPKIVLARGPQLNNAVLSTLKQMASVVGSTLGPGGCPVLIERYENLPPFVTKDGVTVAKSLGFEDSLSQCLMEAARDASVRTAQEAGDGTTTAIVLADAIVQNIHQYCAKHPKVSPQKVVRHLERVFRDQIEPMVKSSARKANLATDEGRAFLRSVAMVSANGDSDLADITMECFGITGDEGNVTILELNGPSRYEAEEIVGFPIPMTGLDESAGRYYPSFINDPGNQRCLIKNPAFILHFGEITEVQSLAMLIERINLAREQRGFTHNVVVVATRFSDVVLATLAHNFNHPTTINVVPLKIPHSIQSNGQMGFLQDLAGITGAKILDPLQAPIEQAQVEDLGPGVEAFESSRFRSTVLGHADEFLLMARVDELKQQLMNPESELDQYILQDRIAKITGGIAKLKVFGSSNAELKEKRDRAEDAVCAVRGAIKHGCLPGGAWMMEKLVASLVPDEIVDEVLVPALREPFKRLLANSGITDENEFAAIQNPIWDAMHTDKPIVYDLLEGKHVDPFEGGILDSTPAVLEAARNALSIATLLGTLGGIVVFARDRELEKKEALAAAAWIRDANAPSPSDERW